MSFHTNRNDVIETGDDIQDVLGVHVGEENGAKVATLKVLLDPRKDFLAIKDFFVHLTNGINHRMLGPFTTAETPADVAAIPAPSAPITETATPVEASPEATQPLVESPVIAMATPTEQGETGTVPSEATTTAEVKPDDSATADTVEIPVVSDTGKKGK